MSFNVLSIVILGCHSVAFINLLLSPFKIGISFDLILSESFSIFISTFEKDNSLYKISFIEYILPEQINADNQASVTSFTDSRGNTSHYLICPFLIL